uniref:Uncharacterized protein n=1 Tax=Setaria italica TaxID=4555 RepID=K3YKB0_SETIT
MCCRTNVSSGAYYSRELRKKSTCRIMPRMWCRSLDSGESAVTRRKSCCWTVHPTGTRRRRVLGPAHPRLARRRIGTCPRRRQRHHAPPPRTAPPRRQPGGARRGTWHGPLLLALAWQ